MNLDIISWAALAVIVGATAFFGFRLLRQRLEQLRYDEQLAELEFQENLLASMSEGGLGDDSRFLQAEAVAVALDNPIPPVVAGGVGVSESRNAAVQSSGNAASNAGMVAGRSVVPTSDNGPPPADVAANNVMKQLGAAGLLSGIDGYVPVHGNPKGAALLRLRDGKTALLVPQMESEAFLRHNARRADMIIMVGHDGKAVVVSTLEHFLAENIG